MSHLPLTLPTPTVTVRSFFPYESDPGKELNGKNIQRKNLPGTFHVFLSPDRSNTVKAQIQNLGFESLTECNKSKSKCRYSPLKQLVVPAGEVPTLFYSLLLRAPQSRLDTDITHFYGKYRNPKFGPNREIDTTQRNIEGCQHEGRVECCGGVEVLL